MNPSNKENKGPVEIVPDLYQIKLPLPIKSLQSVFVYLARSGKNNLLIDTGWPDEASRNALEDSLSEIDISVQEIKTIIVSHLHPDHFGNAQDVMEGAQKSKLIMLEPDVEGTPSTTPEYERFLEELHSWLFCNGVPKEELSAMLDASVQMLHFFRPPKPTFVALGGEVIRVGEKWKFEIIPTPGHTVGNLCLYEKSGSRIFFSGDHVLPTITPNVSLGPRYRGDPLGDYMDSLGKIKQIDTSVVLPSHEFVFSNLKQRVSEIEAHHRCRLAEVLDRVKDAESASAYEIARGLHWSSKGDWQLLSPWDRRMAVMETLAHLEYLRKRGSLLETKRNEGSAKNERVSFSLAEI